jgi:hypothetical protein
MDGESIDSGRENYCSVVGDPPDPNILSELDEGSTQAGSCAG